VEIRVWRGDITTLDVDAIVNAANEALARGGGVCGAIFRAAGRRLDDVCASIGHGATGDAVATPGFDLPARWVIHTVGPVWHDGHRGEADLLASCYRSTLRVARELGARSVAIPAISTGIYGFPADQAAEIAVATLTASGSGSGSASVAEVLLVAFDDETEQRYRTLIGG
jgi:O-acetyl-ADP-ribose deacetylase (regulator of RNase III)